MSRLREFVRESNQIEGIIGEPTSTELEVHRVFLDLSTVGVANLEAFVTATASAALRERPGMNVRVGTHFPPPGGPGIRTTLEDLLAKVEASYLSPYQAHVAYEKLHPFMDGNGRSGRVLWAWQMCHERHDPFALPFLHRFYYQALDASRDE